MNTKKIIEKIVAITIEISDNFPELYLLLDETPVSVSAVNKEIDLNDYEQYFNTIETLLKEKISNEKNLLLVTFSKPIECITIGGERSESSKCCTSKPSI